MMRHCSVCKEPEPVIVFFDKQFNPYCKECFFLKTMKIEDLKLGDVVKVKFNSVYPSEDKGQILRIEEGSDRKFKFLVATEKNGKICFSEDFILSKLEPIPIQYKEIPIEKPKSWKFDLKSEHIGRWYQNKWFHFPIPEGFDFNKKYSIEIKEL